LLSKSGEVDGAVLAVRNITERKRQEDDLRAANSSLARANRALTDSALHYKELADFNLRLAREVEHRVRNNLQGLFGLLQAMRDRATDVKSFADALEAHLLATQHVHELLAQNRWTPVGVRSLIDGALATLQHMAPHLPGQTQISGSDILIGQSQLLPLTLVLVEWFINSCKYGVHSVPGGQLDIAWHLQSDSAHRRIRLNWTERGGPPINRPVVPSLGTELVRGFVVGELAGSVELGYPPEGATHVLEFSIREDS
jgi:two-component sensor histidine kinase